jgi:hypothetical protein
MNPISKCVEGDDGYHVKGALVVAPDRSIRQALEQEKRIIAVCGNHPVFVISPWLRYARCPCCSELTHVTNFSDADFIPTLLADLTKLWYHIRKMLHPVKIIDGFELICGNSYTKEKVEHAINTGWTTDPVHPSKHVYAKTALHLLEKIAPGPEKTSTSVSPAAHPPGRKRTWSDSNRSDAGATSGTQRYGGGSGNSGGYGVGGYGGGGGYPTPRSQTWKERRDSGSRGGGGAGGGSNQRVYDQQARMSDGGGFYAEHGRDRRGREWNAPWEGRNYSGGGDGGRGGYGGGYGAGYSGDHGGRGGGGRGRRN